MRPGHFLSVVYAFNVRRFGREFVESLLPNERGEYAVADAPAAPERSVAEHNRGWLDALAGAGVPVPKIGGTS